jgi:hypothetical protein
VRGVPEVAARRAKILAVVGAQGARKNRLWGLWGAFEHRTTAPPVRVMGLNGIRLCYFPSASVNISTCSWIWVAWAVQNY